MNRKSNRNKTRQPAEKTLPAAVHATITPVDEATTGGPLADGHGEMETPAAPIAATADASAADSASAPAHKADKPQKPVTFSVTLPGHAAQLLEQLRQTHGTADKKLKKSVLVRAALLALAETDPDRIAAIVGGLDVPQATATKGRKGKKK